jgi:hypothetical protein
MSQAEFDGARASAPGPTSPVAPGRHRRWSAVRLLPLAVLVTAATALLAPAAASAGTPTSGAAAGYAAAVPAKTPAAPKIAARVTPAGVPLAARNASGGPVALHLDGLCQVGDLCVFSGPNFTGALADFFFAESNWNLVAPQVANNDLSAFNADPNLTALLCTNVNFVGPCGALAPFTGGNAAAPFFLNSESNFWIA